MQVQVERNRPTESSTVTSRRIRSNLFFKLGVDPNQALQAPTRKDPSLLGNTKIQKEPLKALEEVEEKGESPESSRWSWAAIFGKQPQECDNDVVDETPMPSLSSSMTSREGPPSVSSTSPPSPTRRKLTFNEEVEVCLIPKKEEYSKRIRGFLWNSPEDLMLNARRNSVEFAAEGWDWRNAMEDENMYRCLSTNELIHPVHIEQQLP